MHAVTITQITPPELQELIENTLNKILSKQQAPTQADDAYITRKEACEILHITLSTLLKWTLSGTVKGYRVGRRVLYKRNEIKQAVTAISANKKTR